MGERLGNDTHESVLRLFISDQINVLFHFGNYSSNLYFRFYNFNQNQIIKQQNAKENVDSRIFTVD